MLMWLRHKLFGTEFAMMEFGSSYKVRKVLYTLEKIPIVNVYGEFYRISREDQLQDYKRWIWLYKNKEKAK